MTNEPIVVDFEGFADRRPVLAGVLVGRTFTQTAFTDVEPGIALAARGRRLKCTDFPAFCAALIERARREQRAIAGFSQHELTRIADGLGGAWPEDVEYIDAKKRAKAWRSARHPDAAASVGPERQRLRQKGERCGNLGNRLVDFVRLAGDEVPSGYDDGKVTDTLRRVLGQSDGRRRYRALTQGTREAWCRVLEHNRLDCVWARLFIRMGSSRSRGGRAGGKSEASA